MATIVLPWPPRALSPNGRGHWSKKHKATKIARAYAFAMAKAEKLSAPPGDGIITVTITMQPKTANTPDKDNALASCKAYLDGLADALGVDDSRFDPIHTIGAPFKGGRVLMSIANNEDEQ